MSLAIVSHAVVSLAVVASTQKLEQIQKRAARFITNEYSHLTSVTPIEKSLNLETLEDRKSKSKVVIIHKAFNSNLEIEPNKKPVAI